MAVTHRRKKLKVVTLEEAVKGILQDPPDPIPYLEYCELEREKIRELLGHLGDEKVKESKKNSSHRQLILAHKNV